MFKIYSFTWLMKLYEAICFFKCKQLYNTDNTCTHLNNLYLYMVYKKDYVSCVSILSILLFETYYNILTARINLN